MLPEGWSHTKLGELIKLASGERKPSDTTRERDKTHYVPVYGGNGVMGYSSHSNIISKCISIGRVGEYCGCIHISIGSSWITDNSLYTKHVSKKCDFSFLYYILSFSNISNLRNKGGQPLISQKPIYALSIFLPPLPEQKKIAAILSTWDRAIEVTEKLLANSQQQKKALMQQLLTGKKRLPGFKGEWKHIALQQVLHEEKSPAVQNPQNQELLTVKLHYKGTIPSGKFPCGSEGGRTYHTRRAGTLIIGRQNLHNGGIAIVGDDCDGLIASNAISTFRTYRDYNLKFIFSVMCTHNFSARVDALTGGTGQKEISNRELYRMRLYIPPVAEQKAIASVLTKADEEITLLKSDLTRLRQEKKALMQQLLTGKRRVKIEADAG